ncbi:MAG: hypothetical protein M1826_002957 [Phylliscum demangeonii]|nr:MAG: hypothetical protein M1826_002957 [Phylliscum demangeonii]
MSANANANAHAHPNPNIHTPTTPPTHPPPPTRPPTTTTTTTTAAILRWLQLKRYQYEVNFPLYLLTPIEKFIFTDDDVNLDTTTDSLLFLFLSMIVFATSFYLPQHVATFVNRAWFYYAGEEGRLGRGKGEL